MTSRLQFPRSCLGQHGSIKTRSPVFRVPQRHVVGKIHSCGCSHLKGTRTIGQGPEKSPRHPHTTRRAASASAASQGPTDDGQGPSPGGFSQAATGALRAIPQGIKLLFQAVWLTAYLAFWFYLTTTLWINTDYNGWVGLIPVLLLFVSEWGLLKWMATIWAAQTLHAWPLLIGAVTITLIQKCFEHRLESFNKTMRVLAAILGRDLRAPVMSNWSIISFSQADVQLFPPVTGILADQSDTTDLKWLSLWDLVSGILIIWFVMAHFVMYEQWWGSFWPFHGFNLQQLGTWHMPNFPEFHRVLQNAPVIHFSDTPVYPWGPFK